MISKLINNIKMLFKISKGSTLSMYRARCSIFDSKGSLIRDEILYMRLTDNITQGDLEEFMNNNFMIKNVNRRVKFISLEQFPGN